MTSTQAQIARSSDVIISLVVSVQGRVVERSTSLWHPEVFVAGIYLGCRIIELNKRARVISIPHCHLARACTEQQPRPEDEKALLPQSHDHFPPRKLLSQPLYASGGSGWLCCMPLAIVLLHPRAAIDDIVRYCIIYGAVLELRIVLLHQIWRQYDTYTPYVLYWNYGDDRLCTQLNGGISNHKY